MERESSRWLLGVGVSVITAFVGIGTLHEFYVLPGIMIRVQEKSLENILLHTSMMTHTGAVTKAEFEAWTSGIENTLEETADDVREIREVMLNDSKK